MGGHAAGAWARALDSAISPPATDAAPSLPASRSSPMEAAPGTTRGPGMHGQGRAPRAAIAHAQRCSCACMGRGCAPAAATPAATPAARRCPRTPAMRRRTSRRCRRPPRARRPPPTTARLAPQPAKAGPLVCVFWAGRALQGVAAYTAPQLEYLSKRACCPPPARGTRGVRCKRAPCRFNREVRVITCMPRCCRRAEACACRAPTVGRQPIQVRIARAWGSKQVVHLICSAPWKAHGGALLLAPPGRLTLDSFRCIAAQAARTERGRGRAARARTHRALRRVQQPASGQHSRRRRHDVQGRAPRVHEGTAAAPGGGARPRLRGAWAPCRA